MKDKIYRQDAIDALAGQMPLSYTPDGSHPADQVIFMAQEIYVDCIETIKKLLSAEPEIIYCKNCKYCDTNISPDGNEIYWICKYWDGGTDADGFCHNAERRTDE